MYKYNIVLLVVVFAAVCSASALPAGEVHGAGVARATCDLLSASVNGNSLNHSACAAHCLVLGKGFKGGRCINGVCNCRK